MSNLKWYKIFDGQKEAEKRISINTPQLVVIGKVRICLVRTSRGFYAVSDQCPHRRESLSKGAINYLGEIICPGHNYIFNLGSGVEANGSCPNVATYPVEVTDDGFNIGIPVQGSVSE